MAINALRGIAPEWYTPESEKKEEIPTRFKLRPLTMPQFEQVTVSDGKELGLTMAQYAEVLKMGIVDWENINDPDTGKPLKCSITNHHRIPFVIRAELAVEIYTMSQLAEEMEKN